MPDERGPAAGRRLLSVLQTPAGRILLWSCAVLLLACVAVAPGLGAALVVSQPIARPDAIVSLGSHEWERLPLAARLAGENPEAIVVLTVPDVPSVFNCHDCANRVASLTRRGVGPERVHLVDLATATTYGEAQAVLAFARDAGVRRLVVVTSPYHARRALATFEHVFAGSGIQIGLEPTHDTSPARPSRWFLASYDRAYVAYEWAAIAQYALKHGVPLF
jgi:uncharacterized SAM-binding protein YcdF (DUF218 family)